MTGKKLPTGMCVNVFCPRCVPRVKLVVRTNRANGSQFLGCPNWPECKHTQAIPEDLIMKLHGATPLPGFSRLMGCSG